MEDSLKSRPKCLDVKLKFHFKFIIIAFVFLLSHFGGYSFVTEGLQLNMTKRLKTIKENDFSKYFPLYKCFAGFSGVPLSTHTHTKKKQQQNFYVLIQSVLNSSEKSLRGYATANF